MSIDTLPTFTARVLADSQIEFFCRPCSKWHTHSWDEASEGRILSREAHCVRHHRWFKQYRLDVCGCYDDDSTMRGLVLRKNQAEFINWSGSRKLTKHRLHNDGQSENSRDFMKETVVRLHQNSVGSSALSTNATTEEGFVRELAVVLGDAIGGSDTDRTIGLLRQTIPQVVDVVCKMRGYKSQVTEQRVLIAGEFIPEDVVDMFADRVQKSNQ